MRLGHEHTRARGSGRSRRESGETLIELLATVILMSTGILALITGLFTVVTVSDQVNKQSSSNLGIHGYAESLKDPVGDFQYLPCAQPTGAQSYDRFYDVPDGYTAKITQIRYWTGGVDAATRALTFSSGPCTLATDKGLQEITIQVASDSTKYPSLETLVVTKRDQRCLVQYDNADGKPC